MPDHAPAGPTTEKNPQALIVHSSPELDQLLTSLFQKEKWEIRFAAHNAEALRLAKENSFDLILTGERTPGKEDIELLRRLRMVRPHTRLIILTEEFIPGDVLAAIRECAFSYFSRPFSTEKLAEMIRIAMNKAWTAARERGMHRAPVARCVSVLPGKIQGVLDQQSYPTSSAPQPAQVPNRVSIFFRFSPITH